MAEQVKKSKYSYFGVSIEAPKESPSVVETLRGYQDTIAKLSDVVFYATIIHDKDFKENGEIRKPHLHAFLHLGEDKTLKQALKWLQEALKCDIEAISMEPSNSDNLLVQYLIHKNHPQKAQYNQSEVRTNNNEILEEKLNKEYIKPKNEADIVLEAIEDSKSLLELSRKIGIDKANKFRATYNQIKQEAKADIENLYKKLETTKEDLHLIRGQLSKIIDLYYRGKLLERDIAEAMNLLNKIDFYN